MSGIMQCARVFPAGLVMAIVVAAGIPAQAQGQDRAWPERGDLVRIKVDETSGEFVVSDLQPEGLLLRADSASTEFEVPSASLLQLDVYRGRNSRLRGVLLGGLAGGVLGGVMALPCIVQVHFDCSGSPATHRTLIGVGVGTLVGLVGWGGREIWQSIRLPGRRNPTDRDYRPRDPSGANSTVDAITREQIASLPNLDAEAIVRLLQPSWLRARTQATIGTAQRAIETGADPAIYPVVFLDEFQWGPLETLAQFRSQEIERIEFLHALDATTLYGTGYLGGIIRVVSRR